MLKIDKKSEIHKLSKLLLEEKVVAFPTETVYGLGAIYDSKKAINRVYELKNRPLDNPLILHISSINMAEQLSSELSQDFYILAKNYWPGSLTLVVKKDKSIIDEVTAGLDTVALRMPDSDIALELINTTNKPLAAPSANLSGKPSPTSYTHVIDDFKNLDGIYMGSDCNVGIESTVLDISTENPVLLRPGYITLEELESTLGKKIIYQNNNDNIKVPKAPGMKYVHYSPKGDVILYYGDNKTNNIKKTYNINLNKKQLIICDIKNKTLYEELDFVCYNTKEEDSYEIARNIYSILRKCDDKDVQLIHIEGLKNEGIGMSVNNRLEKAAKKITKG